mgnify:FL=1
MALVKGAHWGFYIYQLVYFLNPEHRWWSSSLPGLPYPLITSITLLLTYLIARKKYTYNNLSQLPYLKWAVLLILSYCLAYYFAVQPDKHHKFTIYYFQMLVIVAIAYKVLDTQQKLEWALLAYLVGAAYIGYEAYVVGRDEFGRVEGIGMVDAPESNGTAAAIAPAISILIFYFWKGGIKLKLATLIMGAFIVNGLVLINSRGAFLGAAISGIYFIFEMFKGKVQVKSQKLIAATFIILGLAAMTVVVDESFMNRMNTLSEVEDESKSGSHRYRLWLIALEMSPEYPFGTGAFGYQHLSPQYVPEALFFNNQKKKAVHSIWMQCLSEVGWIGFLSFIIIVLYCLRFLSKIKAKCVTENNTYNYYLAQALLSAFLGMLVASSFIDQFRVQIVYWMILFVTCYYNIIINNHAPGSSELTEDKGKQAATPKRPT